MIWLVVVAIVSLMQPPASWGQLWSGYYDNTRGADWQGLVYTPPDTTGWTQCGATIAAYTGTPATINDAIAACGPNQYVLLGAGTFSLSSHIDTGAKSAVILRGSGPLQTTIINTGSGSCTNGGTVICVNGANGGFFNSGAPNQKTVTAGTAPGATTLTLNNVTDLSVGKVIFVFQDNEDNAITYAPFVTCSLTHAGYDTCVGTIDNAGKGTIQAVKITAIAGNDVTFTPGLIYQRWSQSRNPKVEYFSNAHATEVGVENLTVEHAGAPSNVWGLVQVNAADGFWVSNVRVNGCVNLGACMSVYQSRRGAIYNNYLYKSDPGVSTRYGVVTCCGSTGIAIYNNICQQVQTCVMGNGGTVGIIAAYNFARNQPWNASGANNPAIYPDHATGTMYTLIEGNDVNGVSFDYSHGVGCCHTVVRNVLHGQGYDNALLTTSNTMPFLDLAWDRFISVFGNVLGLSAYHTDYEVASNTGAEGAPTRDKTIFFLGFCSGSEGTSCGSQASVDNTVKTSLLRWGNYDVVNAANQFVSGEIPSDQSVPATNTVPASFYLSAKPSWFGSVTWPPIGPDVTGGNISGYGGRAYKIPARNCYESLGGPADGTGSVLAFDASTCYGGSSSPGKFNPNLNIRRVDNGELAMVNHE